MIFNDHYFCKCFNVTVLNNDYLENFETFTINITSYELLPTSLYFDDSPTIHLRAGSTEIIIEDDDGKLELTTLWSCMILMIL